MRHDLQGASWFARLCLVSVLVASGFSVIWAADPSVPAEGQAALSTFLRDAVARGEVPGVVAMVVGRDRILYHEAFGKLDVARNVEMSGTPSSASRR